MDRREEPGGLQFTESEKIGAREHTQRSCGTLMIKSVSLDYLGTPLNSE